MTEPVSFSSSANPLDVAVIGGGPAGLMAAHRLAQQGLRVAVFDGSASVGRKFLLAGRGGLNLTHSEPMEPFVSRFGAQQAVVGDWLKDFGAEQVQAWAHGLGIETFVGTSGRVFPTDMKAAPLLRAWLAAMRSAGIRFAMRHRWLGWGSDKALRFATPEGEVAVYARTTVLALGGGSWARLGSDGSWMPLLADAGIATVPLQAANCGFDVRMQNTAGVTAAPGATDTAQAGWSPFFATKFAGQPFKSVAIRFDTGTETLFNRRGEFVATEHGVEGSLVYAVSSHLREAITQNGSATFTVDLLPNHSAERVLAEVRHPRGSRSLANHLKGRLGLDGIKAALLFEVLGLPPTELSQLPNNLLPSQTVGTPAKPLSPLTPLPPQRVAHLAWLGLSAPTLVALEPFITWLPQQIYGAN